MSLPTTRFDWSVYKDVTDISQLKKTHKGALIRLIRMYKLSYTPIQLMNLLIDGNRICIVCSSFISAELFPSWQKGPYCTKHSRKAAIRYILRKQEGLEVNSPKEALIIGEQTITRICVDCKKPFFTKRSGTSKVCKYCHRRRGQTRERKIRGQQITMGVQADLKKEGKILCFGCNTVKSKSERKGFYVNYCQECYNTVIKPKYALYAKTRKKKV